jgi:homoserine O-acetyltransferase
MMARISRDRLFCVLVVAVFSTVALWAQDSEQKFAELGKCKLENGQSIDDCRIGYRTFGKLNSSADNVVLMPTWVHGKSQDLIPYFGDGSSPQHLVDTTRFFGIAIDALGNGVSSSPSNSVSQHATAFPNFTLRDSVNAQYRVMTEVLHIKHLHAVLGLSMGGEQTFVWAVIHPEFFDLAVPILGTPRETSYDLLVKQIQVDAIKTAPGYDNGHYTTEPDMRVENLFGALVVTSPEYRNRETPRDQAAAYIARAGAPQPMDANDRLWQLTAIMQQDVIGNRTIEEVARAALPHFLVIVSGKDHLVNPQPALEWAAAVNAPTYISQGGCAHLIMTCDAAEVSTRVKAFLLAGKLQ